KRMRNRSGLIKDSRYRAVLLQRELDGAAHLGLVQFTAQFEMDVNRAEQIELLYFLTLSLHIYVEALNTLALLFEDADDVDGAAAAEAHEHELHRACPLVVAPYFRVGVQVDSHISGA